ncbi:MAG: GNAT family N-acetyltransferase [Candidatus Tritonobacter lacicola]|nr:GNAT family N-acetyltransferase [Candidatus Tritonobacter lacicola]
MKVITKVCKAKWTEIVRGCSYATFFHTCEWAKVIEDTFDQYKVATKLFVFPDGTEVILPLISSRAGPGGLLKAYRSMVPGVYGNLVSVREISPDKVDRIFKRLLKLNVASISIVDNPFTDYAMPDYFEEKPMFTQILRLRDGFEPLWKNFTKGHRSSAKKAQKMGVTVNIAGSLEDYREYFRIYQDSVKRWGERATSNYPYRLFKNIYNMQSPGVRLWLAKINGKTISGALVFYHNKHVVWWHGATLGEYFRYCPANLLQTEIIKDSCRRSYEIYDFNPSGGHGGVVKFKRSFGSQTIDMTLYKSGHGMIYGIYKKLRSKLK